MEFKIIKFHKSILLNGVPYVLGSYDKRSLETSDRYEYLGCYNLCSISRYCLHDSRIRLVNLCRFTGMMYSYFIEVDSLFLLLYFGNRNEKKGKV